jgi:DNA-binding NtrC family response regulator
MGGEMDQKVLMIIEDEDLLHSLRYYFSESFQLVSASSAEQGLQILRSEIYQVVIFDDLLQTRDGALFENLIQASAPTAAQILLSNAPVLPRYIRGIRKGKIFQSLRKPFTPEMLERSIRVALEQQQRNLAEADPLVLVSANPKPALGKEYSAFPSAEMDQEC